VIAGPTKKFSEQEKYILDQYIMKGGRVLWLVDGVYFSEEELAARGKSVTVGNRTSIDDLLFTYGVRINPALLQDEQSASILLSSGSGKQSQSAIVPWYFCPLLMPSPNHPVTKDIALVKAPYVSPLDVIKQPGVKANVLLTTSDKTHLVKATEQVDFDSESITNKDRYFDQKFLVAGVALEGKFTSAYINRIAPDSILQHGKPNKNESISTKMIVLGSSGIIRNEIAGEGQQSQVIPLGLDRISGMQFGNRNFIVNAVNWLANDDGWINLREKQQQLRLLNKVDIKQKRNLYVAINLSIPLLIICGYLAFLNVRRKRKYGRI
jgi:ABC-2 type transport system permease protein